MCFPWTWFLKLAEKTLSRDHKIHIFLFLYLVLSLFTHHSGHCIVCTTGSFPPPSIPPCILTTIFHIWWSYFHVCDRLPKQYSFSNREEKSLFIGRQGHLRLSTLLKIAVPIKQFIIFYQAPNVHVTIAHRLSQQSVEIIQTGYQYLY